MKRIFLALNLCLLGTFIHAQSLELRIDGNVIKLNDTVYVTGKIDASHDYLKVYFVLRNTSSNNLILSGAKTTSYIHPEALDAWCGFNTCWDGPNISNISFAAGAVQGADSMFYGEFFPEATLDKAWIHYGFWVSDNEADAVGVHVNYIPTSTIDNRENKAATALSFFPNPAADYVQINGLDMPSKISIYTSQGILIRSIERSTDGMISLKGLHKGLYLLRVDNSKMQQTLKLLIP